MVAELHQNHFIVHTMLNSWWVSTEMARHIERALDVRRPARWVTFVDVTGARVRLLAEAIYCVELCSAEPSSARPGARSARRAKRRRARDGRQTAVAGRLGPQEPIGGIARHRVTSKPMHLAVERFLCVPPPDGDDS